MTSNGFADDRHEPGLGIRLGHGVVPRRLGRDDKVKPRTRATYRHLLDRHLLPVFGETPVRDITPDMVASWYESLAGTPGARAGAYGLLKRVLASACEPPGPLLEFNPCRIRGGATLRSAERPVVGPGAVRWRIPGGGVPAVGSAGFSFGSIRPTDVP
ncbi:hypothetical protein [Bifidobacterium bifidum]|uniref:N-terminal phage integrase SAM-like domain-containing protein n=1 Tax=Bifidobacterium bifidum TaxID=1681 RepID=UPI003D043D67